MNGIRKLIESKTLQDNTREAISLEIQSQEGNPSLIFKYDVNEIARQLTMVEFSLFIRIEPCEYYYGNWTKSKKNELAPNITKMMSWYNTVVNFIISTICQHDLVIDRVKVMTYWIAVAEIFRKLGNYSGLMQVLSAFNSNAIYKLKNTKKILEHYEDSVHWRTYSELNEIFSIEKISNVRDTIDRKEGPCIPWLGVFFPQLIKIQENPTRASDDLPKGIVNFSMRKQLATILIKLDSYQKKPYNLDFSNRAIIDIILNSNILTENESYERSKQIEPPIHGSTTPKRKSTITRPSFHLRKSTHKSKASTLLPSFSISTPPDLESTRLQALISPRRIPNRAGTHHSYLATPLSARERTITMSEQERTTSSDETTFPQSISSPYLQTGTQSTTWESASPRKNKPIT